MAATLAGQALADADAGAGVVAAQALADDHFEVVVARVAGVDGAGAGTEQGDGATQDVGEQLAGVGAELAGDGEGGGVEGHHLADALLSEIGDFLGALAGDDLAGDIHGGDEDAADAVGAKQR